LIGYYLVTGIAIAIVVIFRFCLKKTFKKLSWKFLAWFLVLSKIPDIISTIITLEKFKHDGSVYEVNIAIRLMQAHIDFPLIVILLIHSIVIVSFFLFIFRIAWNSSKFSRAVVKILLLFFSIGSIIATLSNLGLYFFL